MTLTRPRVYWKEPVFEDLRFARLFEVTSSAMLLADDDRVIVEANRAACDLLAFSHDQLLGMRIEDLSGPGLREAAPEMFAAFLAEGTQSGPFTLVKSDGGSVDCQYSAVANIVPGQHLSILVPVERSDQELDVLIGESATPGGETEKGPRLTAREAEVLSLLALGNSNKEIAEMLNLSPETVRSYTRTARFRLGAKSRSQAIAMALRSGQLDPDISNPGTAQPDDRSG